MMTNRLLSAAALLLASSLLAAQGGFILPAAAHDGHAHQQPAAAPAPAPRSSPWGSSYFPNVPLVTQEGKTVRFYEDLMQGKKVLINFIFAQCDKGCPLDTANMARVQQLLGERVGRDVFMYSITLDPEHDTPQALKAYAEQFGAKPGWLFLTGKREDIDQVRFKLGSRSAKEQHANTVQVGDVPNGRWMRVPLTADPNYIALEAKNTLYPGWSAGKTLKSIAQAERLEVFGPGQLLFHNRCAGCHTFGKGNLLGPDLQGVNARRARDWLIRFIAAPDRMRASRDPIALELARQYKVRMPNLALTKKELGELMDYLDAQNSPRPKPQAATGDEKPSPVARDHYADHHHVSEEK